MANAHTHAMAHCRITTPMAHFCPSSLRMDAMAAIHGVSSKQNTSNAAAAFVDISDVSAVVVPNKIDNVETTLSLAIKPVINAVDILQSPNPSGAKTGAITPAIPARILSLDSVTIFRSRLNVVRNQTIIVARNITENAR